MNGTNLATAYGGPATASEPVRVSEVSGEMEKLVNQCDHLDKQVEILETRLGSVLAQRGEVGANEQKVPEPVRVPLAQGVHDRVRHLSGISDRLDSIINRIEL